MPRAAQRRATPATSLVSAGETTASAGWPRFSASVPYVSSDGWSVRTCSSPRSAISSGTRSCRDIRWTGQPAGPSGSGSSALTHVHGVDEADDAIDASFEFLHRRRVRDADEPRSIERLARCKGDLRLVQQRLRKLGRRPDPVRRQNVGDVDKQVERPGRYLGAQPRLGGQPPAQLVASPPILVQHVIDTILWPV